MFGGKYMLSIIQSDSVNHVLNLHEPTINITCLFLCTTEILHRDHLQEALSWFPPSLSEMFHLSRRQLTVGNVWAGSFNSRLRTRISLLLERLLALDHKAIANNQSLGLGKETVHGQCTGWYKED